MKRCEEQANILAVVTGKVDRWGRVQGLGEHAGKAVRVLALGEEARVEAPERRPFRR